MGTLSNAGKTFLSVVLILAAFAGLYIFGLRRPTPTGREIPLAPMSALPTVAPVVNNFSPPLPTASPEPTSVPTPTPESKKIAIFVNGAVARPGVYRLPEYSRVVDALDAAGGLLAAAEADGVNQARLLRDGEQVFVPYRGTPLPPGLQPGGPALSTGKAAPTATPSGPINLNRATKEELDTLPGIGPALSERIIEYRQKNGPFQRPDDLKKVQGIGDKLYESLHDRITAP